MKQLFWIISPSCIDRVKILSILSWTTRIRVVHDFIELISNEIKMKLINLDHKEANVELVLYIRFLFYKQLDLLGGSEADIYPNVEQLW